jgi:hypothetical protein
MKCKVCGEPTTRPKFCSDKCQKKAWKLYNRQDYLTGKLKYRREHKEQILEYKRLWRVANPEKVKSYNLDYKRRQNGD